MEKMSTYLYYKIIPSSTTLTTKKNTTYQFGLEWWLYLFVLKAFPVNASEEGVFSNIPLSLRAAAQTLGWMLGHQLLIVRKKKKV